MSANPDDIRHMRHALVLARRALGMTAPNPAVGCVVVSKDGLVAGRGCTGEGGRPHAEVVALAEAGGAARGGTVYVTLEPCSHQGVTPPCADALVSAGIARAVVAVVDPDPRVCGKGLSMLRDGGVAVTSGVCQAEAAALNAGFFRRVRDGRPSVTLKLAQSLDGKTAAAGGDSRWITGKDARRLGHLMRARHDAILVGAGTVIADDPELNCRLPGLAHRSPVRVVLDTNLRIPVTSRVVRTASTIPTILFTTAECGGGLAAHGVQVVTTAPDANGRPDLEAVLQDLGGRGITRLLVEGGATVHAAFLTRGLVDRLDIFTAPLLLGGAGNDGVGALPDLTLKEAPRFRRTGRRPTSGDLLESFVRED